MARTKPGNTTRKRAQHSPGGRSKGYVIRGRATGRVLGVRSNRPVPPVRDDEDAKWDATSTRYADKLALLADKALTDFAAGRTTPIDPDTM